MFVAVKNHFTRKDYDYIKYGGKTTITMKSYMKRKDRFFFEKVARIIPAANMEDHIIGNVVSGKTGLQVNPDRVWIGTLASQEGIDNGLEYMKKKQSVEYLFKSDLTTITEYDKMLTDVDKVEALTENQFPALLSLYYDGKISPETLIILDAIMIGEGKLFTFWDNKLLVGDPLWHKTSIFLRKYQRLALQNINQDIDKYRKFVRTNFEKNTI